MSKTQIHTDKNNKINTDLRSDRYVRYFEWAARED